MDKIFICLMLWLLMGSLNAYYAHLRGRDPIAWFMLGVPLGLLGLIILFFLPNGQVPKHFDESHFPETTPRSEINDVNAPNSEALTKEWYYIDNQQQRQGPISLKDLQFHFFQKDLSYRSLVWSEGMDQWEKVEDIPQLKSLASEHQ